MIILMIFIFLLSLALEMITPNLLRNFIPFFIIATILISSMLKVDDSWFYLIIFITGVLYDLTCTNAVFLHGFIFCFLGYLASLIVGNKKGFFTALLTYYGMSILYVFLIMIFTFTYVPDKIVSLASKFSSSLVINSLYFLLFYLLFIGLKGLLCNRNKKSSYF